MDLADKSNIKNNIASILISLLFIGGIFIPTSIDSVINRNLTMAINGIILTVLIVLISLIKKIEKKFLISFLLINIIMWTATLFNPQAYIVKTTIILYLIISILFCVDFKSIDVKKSIPISFMIVNIIFIVIGFGMIFHNDSIDNFFLNWYSDFYPELLPNMLGRGKPVITFGTHSVAAFYMFIFFYLNLRTYAIMNKKLHLFLSMIFLFFCFSLFSNTGFIFFFIGLIMLFKNIKHKIIALILLTTAVVFYISYNQYEVNLFYLNLQMQVTNTISSNANGVIGRYSENGNQARNIQYLLDHPFSPTGYSTTDNSDLVTFDSGVVVTALQGTFLLTIIVYSTLLRFFIKNIIDKKRAVLIYIFFMIFELGFNNMFYFRTFCIIPLMVLYLNYLEKRSFKLNTTTAEETELEEMKVNAIN